MHDDEKLPLSRDTQIDQHGLLTYMTSTLEQSCSTASAACVCWLLEDIVSYATSSKIAVFGPCSPPVHHPPRMLGQFVACHLFDGEPRGIKIPSPKNDFQYQGTVLGSSSQTFLIPPQACSVHMHSSLSFSSSCRSFSSFHKEWGMVCYRQNCPLIEQYPLCLKCLQTPGMPTSATPIETLSPCEECLDDPLPK